MVPEHRSRCAWAAQDPLLARYHDDEWGVPPTTDDGYFEALMLEIFQAGLSWRTVLYKRDAFRLAFAGFAVPLVASFTSADIERLMGDRAIVRNRRKIDAAVVNARAFQAISDDAGSFTAWLEAIPPDTDAVYRALRSRLAFFGRTTCESFLEAVGKIPATHEPHCWKAG